MGIRTGTNIRIMKKSGSQQQPLSSHKTVRSFVDYSDIDFGNIDMPELRPGNRKLAEVLQLGIGVDDVAMLYLLKKEKKFEDDIANFNSIKELQKAGLLEREMEKREIDNPDYDEYQFAYEDDTEELDRWHEDESSFPLTSEEREDLDAEYELEASRIRRFRGVGSPAKIEKNVFFFRVSKLGEKFLSYLDANMFSAGEFWSPAPRQSVDVNRHEIDVVATIQGREFIQKLQQLKTGTYLRSVAVAGGKTGLDVASKPDTAFVRETLQKISEASQTLQMCAPVLYNREKTLLMAKDGRMFQIPTEHFDIAETYIKNNFFFTTDGTDLTLMTNENELKLVLPGVIEIPSAEALEQFGYFYKSGNTLKLNGKVGN